MAYAGVMPLYAVLARESFPLPIMGTVIGAAALASSLGMAVAQTPRPASPPPPAKPETVVVQAARLKANAPVVATTPAPVATPRDNPAYGRQPSVMPRSHCNTALQNDISGQPGNGQTLTADCPP